MSALGRLVLVLPLVGGCFSSLLAEDEIACRATSDCPREFVCSPVSQQCVRGGGLPGCSRHQDCPFAEICDDGACVAGCIETGDCGLDKDCIEGRCAPKGECTSDAVCAFGELCDKSTRRCAIPRGNERTCQSCSVHWCLSSADCAGGSGCDRPDMNRYGTCTYCGSGSSCRTEPGEVNCTNDSQCGDGTRCLKFDCGLENGCTPELGSCEPGSRPGEPRTDGVGQCSIGRCGRAFCVAHDCALPEDDTPGISCGKGYDCYTIISEDVQPCTAPSQCASGLCGRLNEALATLFCGCRNDADCTGAAICANGYCVDDRICAPTPGLDCEDVRP